MNLIKKGSLLIAKKTDKGFWEHEDLILIDGVGSAQLPDNDKNGDIYALTILKDGSYFAFNCTDKESSLYVWKWFYTKTEYRKEKLKRLEKKY